jgi:hydrogenase/urease accessory protein HupE
MNVLRLAAAAEGALAVALLIDPQLVFGLLLSANVSGAAIVVGRFAGLAFLGLSLACWPERGASARRLALRAMLAYNALATLYLVSLGSAGEWVGPLLWPAAVIHAALTVGCIVVLRRAGGLVKAASFAFVLCALTLAQQASAHDARPAYLQIQEITPGRYDVLWRTPVLSGARLPVSLRLPDAMRTIAPTAVQELSDSLVERRLVEADVDALARARIEFPGLEATITDVLVRVAFLDGTSSTRLVRGNRPWVELTAAPGSVTVAGAYLAHGVEHILFGYDHLLFVLALILIVPSTRMLFFTVTAFTIAHSLTLALATLRVVHVPGPPVEASIALSILLLATELVRARRGQIGLTARWPWLVAFGFGLLHGFGFASALIDLGLPQGDIPLALFAFNVGVECGQLCFVAAVLSLAALARRIRPVARMGRYASQAAPYAIGALAAFWFVERLARF